MAAASDVVVMLWYIRCHGEDQMSDLETKLEQSIAIVKAGGSPAQQKAESIQIAVADAKKSALELKREETRQFLERFTSLDWTALPPPAVAMLLMQKPNKLSASQGGGSWYLEPWQALAFAIFCRENGVSPFANHAWWNNQTNSANLTTEGKKIVARKQGFNLGAPRFDESLTRPWPKGVGVHPKESDDIAVRCTMSVNDKGDVDYTAWLSEWYMPMSPVWKEKPRHMLRIRAYEKALSFASGAGISEMPGLGDVSEDDDVPAGGITVTPADYKPTGGK